ncbi:MAG: hypothetical protein ABI120_19440 [Gemmatimonadaceae bacterium]
MKHTLRIAYLCVLARRKAVAVGGILLLGVGCQNAASDRAAKDSTTAAATASITPSGAAREVEVLGLDYAFSMPDSLDAGRTAFKFTNSGKVFHEYNLVLLKPDVTLQQFIDAANKQQPLSPYVDGPVGVLFAMPGQTSIGFLSAEMLPGRTYAIQCIFKDSAGAASHREMGMYKSFVVRNNAKPTVAAVAIDTIVGTDYAYTKYPRNIKPGWHHFMFVNEGMHRHEISLGMLKRGVSVTKFIDVLRHDGDIDALMDGDMGVLHAQAGTTPLGTLDFEVLPDREYVIVCEFRDSGQSPPHFALGMVTSMLSSR